MRVLMISEHASPLSLRRGGDSGGQNGYVAKPSESLAHHGMEGEVATHRDASQSIFNALLFCKAPVFVSAETRAQCAV